MKYLSDYVEEAQNKLFDECGVFFAFSKDQFEKGCKKVGASADNKITNIDAGCYCLSKHVDTFIAGMEEIQKRGIEQDIAENGIKNIIWRELGNYETQITCDISQTVATLEDYPIMVEQIQAEYRPYMDECIKNDWF